MHIFGSTWDLRAVWTSFPLLTKCYLGFLFAASCRSLAVWVRCSLRIRAVRMVVGRDGPRLTLLELRQLRTQVGNLGQLNLLLLLGFGACAANELLANLRTVPLRKSGIWEGPELFVDLAAFGLVTFAFLLVLSAGQWMLSAWMEATATKLDEQRESIRN